LLLYITFVPQNAAWAHGFAPLLPERSACIPLSHLIIVQLILYCQYQPCRIWETFADIPHYFLHTFSCFGSAAAARGAFFVFVRSDSLPLGGFLASLPPKTIRKPSFVRAASALGAISHFS
jgi:hypothetical protein